ncbi:MAG: HAD family hydrolase [Nanobdellota archaeon]
MGSAAIFDVDKTLLNGNSGLIYTKLLIKEGYFGLFDIIKAGFFTFLFAFKIIDYRVAMGCAYSLLKGVSRDDFLMVLEKYYFSHIKPVIFRRMIKEIGIHKKRNRKIVFATNSMKEMVEKLADDLKADFLIATEADVKYKKFTGDLKKPCFGKFKAKRVKNLCKKEGISLNDSYAYTDHHSDEYLLRLVGNPVAVNPDKKLKKFAKICNWKVIEI